MYGFMSGLFYFFVLFVIISGKILAFASYGIIVYYFQFFYCNIFKLYL